jgi:undecaprenyl-diphosphatase
MNQFLHTYIFAVPVIILTSIYIAMDIFYTKLEWFNRWVRILVHRNRVQEIRNFMVLTHKYNDIIPSSLQIIGVAMILGFVWKDWKSGVFLISSLMIQLAVVSFTKQIAQRTRPPHLTAHKIMTSGSYPSGHSASTLAMALLVPAFMIPYLPVWAVAAILSVLVANALTTAYGRLYLDMHWATDILGGWILAIITTLVTYYIRVYT